MLVLAVATIAGSEARAGASSPQQKQAGAVPPTSDRLPVASGGAGQPLERRLARHPLGQSVFTDPSNDSGDAADIVEVRVSNHVGGLLVFAIDVRIENADPRDRFLVFIDADQNPATGGIGFLGAEYLIDFDVDFPADDLALARWNGSDWDYNVPQASLARSVFSFGLDIQVNLSELGNTGGFNFWVRTLFPDGADVPDIDEAPNEFIAWNYQVAFDTAPPSVRTFAATCSAPCRAGSTVALVYLIDPSEGDTQEEITVEHFLSGRWLRVGTPIVTQLGENPASGSVVPWSAPARIVGWHRFCVVTIDEAGNRSASSCQPIAFPKVNASLTPRRQPLGSSVRLLRLTISELPTAGRARISITCVKLCNLNVSRTTGGRSFAKAFPGGVLLPRGAEVAVRVLKDHWVGWYQKLTVVGGGEIRKSAEKCLPPGMKAPPRRPRCR